MKKIILLTMVASFLFLCGCKPDNSIKMGYDETKSPPILEMNLDKSPKDNVKAYIEKSGVGVNAITIYSSDTKRCACAKHGKDCLCRLSNKEVGDHSCGDAKTKCKKTKYIEVKVDPENVDALTALGFKQK